MPAPSPHFEDACPACKRYIGLHLDCPYCGQESPHRPLQRTLRLTAIILSIGGLATLLLIRQQSSPPLLPIPQLRPVMNHGYVTLAGTVVAEPRINGNPEAPQSISFDLTDAGEQLTVMATKETARNLLVQNNLPDAHRSVQVTGHLYLAAGKPHRLYLESAQSLHPLSVPP